MRSESYWVCVVCVCVCYKSHLTYGASVRPENAVTYSASNEGQNIGRDLPETTAFKSYAAKYERKSQYANYSDLPAVSSLRLKHSEAPGAVADLGGGGVPRVPEPPLVELDIGQAGRWLRRCACCNVRKSCVCGYASICHVYIAASSWPSSSIHHERVDKSFRFVDLSNGSLSAALSPLGVTVKLRRQVRWTSPPPASAAGERGERYL